MQFKTLFTTTLLAGSILAAPQAAPAGGDMTPAQQVSADQLCTGSKTWVVNVSDSTDALKFSPNNIKAAAGECVQFQFWPNNHSVVQADFANPCQPTANTTGAFFSGFMPVDQTTAGKLTYTVKVTDTTPKWFYCSQAKHCQSGMVGAINAADTGDKTVTAFAAAAANVQASTSPGEAAASGSTTGGAATTTGAAGAISTGAASSLSETARHGAWGMGLSALAAFLFF